ncbi:MAG: histidine phosphatase family protein [Actinobacteria bacterium]|nr:histidine phosphatase family protein [Actinomycetota bacterium]
MRLLLVRHGQTPSNLQGLLDTAAPGPGLTALGERQSAAIPAAFHDDRIDLIAVSPLLRTGLTAAPLAQARGLTPMLLPGLAEIEAGDLEMRGDRASVHTYIGTAIGWVTGDPDARMPGGESGRAFFARYDAAIAEIAASGATTAVAVSHGAAIRVWASARARGVDLAVAEHQGFPNTGYVELAGDPVAGWDLVRWHSEPAGGASLTTGDGPDPTGDAIDD